MLNKKTGLIAILISVAAGQIWADTITNYAVGDVLVCFRKGTVDMVVDAGPISTFTGATHNQRITITQYTGAQLAEVGTNGVSWSAFTWLADNTLYVTKPRTSVSQQTIPWLAQSSPAQFGVLARMETIPPGALDELNPSGSPVYPESTSTAVVEEDSSSGNPNYVNGVSYHDALAGAYGSAFDGKFENGGNVENTTPVGFASSGTPLQSEFFQLIPGSGASQYLGFFQLANDGSLAFIAAPVPEPSSWALAGVGALLLAAWRRSRH